MDQITITRAEFKERIINNPRRYGVARMMRENPEKAKGHEIQAFIEECTLMIALKEIETDLFGDEKEQKTEPAVPDLPFC